jgi:hypothetical protein
MHPNRLSVEKLYFALYIAREVAQGINNNTSTKLLVEEKRNVTDD